MSNKLLSPKIILIILLLALTLTLPGCSKTQEAPTAIPQPTQAPTVEIASPSPAPTTAPTATPEAKPESKKEEKKEEAEASEDKSEYPMAYDFTAKDLLTGKEFSLSDFRGKVVFLNFWGSWCPPCRMEMPAFQKVYEDYDGQVVIIGVGINDNPGSLTQFAKSINITYPITHDRTSEIARHYRIRSLPTTYRIDQEGRVRGVAVGALTEEQLTKAIEELLSEK